MLGKQFKRLILIMMTMMMTAAAVVASTAACGQTSTQPPSATPVALLNTPEPPTPTKTHTEVSTATPSPTPTTTPTPLPTPTPTPTAIPLSVSGDPRAATLATPEYNSRYPCGAVDTFDFPLNPPDAVGLSGGSDFGIYRSRFEKFHAGEDWWHGRGASFGQPVYAIGHGLVTYADGDGWGRDKGVVIVQHTYVDGSQVLSFYGHLDPPSVTLAVGACVQRGDYVGDIGRPRSSPHLHFEMRTQSPWSTLTGYWPDDPRAQGWLPPSQTIWAQRVRVAPGVQWSLSADNTAITPIGLAGDALLALNGDALTEIALADGATQTLLRAPEDEPGVAQAALSADSTILYTTDRFGRLTAYPLPFQSDPLWTVDLDLSYAPDLLPLPGGVLATWRTGMHAVSAGGESLWQTEDALQPFAILQSDDALLFSTLSGDEGVWQLTAAQPPVRVTDVGGKLAQVGRDVWILGSEGVYRWRQGADSAELRYTLPRGSLQRGDIAALPNGAVLIAHADPFDRRLLLFNPDGTLRWERSYAAAVSGDIRLPLVGGVPYITALRAGERNGELQLYGIDLATGALTHLFTGGTRSPEPGAYWALPVDAAHLLLNVGGGSLALFAPDAAAAPR